MQTSPISKLRVGAFEYPLAHGSLRVSTSASGIQSWEVTAQAVSLCQIAQDTLHQLDFVAGGQHYLGTAWCDNMHLRDGITMTHHFAGSDALGMLPPTSQP